MIDGWKGSGRPKKCIKEHMNEKRGESWLERCNKGIEASGYYPLVNLT